MKTLKSMFSVFVLGAAFVITSTSQTPMVNLAGGSVDLSAQKGKVVVLAVGASWLPLSKKQAEDANALAKRYAGKDVVFYFIVTDSTDTKSKNFADNSAVQKFVTANKITMTVLRDSDGAAVREAYKVDQIPTFLILDRTGNQSGAAFGGIDPKFDITVPIGKKVDSLL